MKNLGTHWKLFVILLAFLTLSGFFCTLRWKPYPNQVLSSLMDCYYMELPTYKEGFRLWINMEYPNYQITPDMNEFQLLAWERTFLKYSNNDSDYDHDMNGAEIRASSAWLVLFHNRHWLTGPLNGTKFSPTTDPQTGFTTGVLNENLYSVGRCGEFAGLFYGLLVMNGIKARMVVDTSMNLTKKPAGDHVWIEIYYNSSEAKKVGFPEGWVHVDPTEDKWNDPKMYVRVSSDGNPYHEVWGKDINDVYAITGESIVDVTTKYQ